MSSFTVTRPLPSILATRFCSTVCLAQRNSPFAASKLQAMPVLQGMPVSVLRGPLRASGLTDSMPAAFASGLTGVLMTIISKVHSWSQLSRGKVWYVIQPVAGTTYLGPIPPELIEYGHFGVAIRNVSKNEAEARDVIKFMTSPEAA